MKPRFARNIYFGLQWVRGERVQRALKDVQRTEFISRDQLQSIQAERQLDQLRYAVQYVPHYQSTLRDFREAIEQARTWEDVNILMEALPVIGKDEVRSHPDWFTSNNARGIRTYPDKTSGSTGTPLNFPCDQDSWAYRHALTFRCMQAYGVAVGEPYVYIWGLHWSKSVRRQMKLRDFILNRIRVNAFDVGPHMLDRHISLIYQKHPTHFWGYPATIADLCQLASGKGFDFRSLKLKAVFVTGEPLYPYQREIIEEVTGTRCVNTYGSAEGGFNAFECPESSLHLTSEATWLQLCDSSQGSGEVVVTDFMLRAFPMIRYSLGDEVVLKPGTCLCGRPHPMLASIEGRCVREIKLPNGRVINDHLLTYIFKPIASLGILRKYRFIEYPDGRLDLFLVVTSQCQPHHLAKIEKETRLVIGNDVDFSLRCVDSLPDLENAKHRSYVRATAT